MDLLLYALVGCGFVACVFYSYKSYKKSFETIEIYSPAYVFIQEVILSNRKINPCYTFDLSHNEYNIEDIISNDLLKGKLQLLETIKYTHQKYETCTDVNSYIFYFSGIPILKIIFNENYKFNIISQIKVNTCKTSVNMVYKNNYQFDISIPYSEDIYLTPDGYININKNLLLYNYEIINEICRSQMTFFGIRNIIFTYYNIPLIKLNIIDQQCASKTLIIDYQT